MQTAQKVPSLHPTFTPTTYPRRATERSASRFERSGPAKGTASLTVLVSLPLRHGTRASTVSYGPRSMTMSKIGVRAWTNHKIYTRNRQNTHSRLRSQLPESRTRTGRQCYRVSPGSATDRHAQLSTQLNSPTQAPCNLTPHLPQLAMGCIVCCPMCMPYGICPIWCMSAGGKGA